jgi:prepilin-type N-terminal cleavage/methylation domain-containing protein
MNPPSQVKAKSSAFTLIEILVVVTIIAILAALGFPVVGKMMQSSSSAKALTNFRSIATANIQYSADNDGQLLGWGRYEPQGGSWDDQVFLMRNLNLYLTGVNVTGTSTAAVDKIANGLLPFVDPAVPKANIKYASFPFTWSINNIFNRANGRFNEFKGTDREVGWSSVLNPRRVVEFEKPAGTIFAVSGGFEFSKIKAADEGLLNPTVPRPSIFYLYGSKNTTPAVFLDGHAELLSFPISPEKIIPSLN